MSERWRLFVGVQLPPLARDALVRARPSSDAGGAVRWERADLLHVTVHFLGSTERDFVPSIIDALKERVAPLHALSLTLEASGAFPTPERARVIWVGLGGAVDQMQRLQTAVVGALTPLGFPAESRPYHAHVTIGRVRRDSPPAARRLVAGMVTKIVVPSGISFAVNNVTLFRSTLVEAKLRYVDIGTVELSMNM